jgi:hypothetical protein
MTNCFNIESLKRLGFTQICDEKGEPWVYTEPNGRDIPPSMGAMYYVSQAYNVPKESIRFFRVSKTDWQAFVEDNKNKPLS